MVLVAELAPVQTTTCCVKIYADTNKNLGDNINGKIQQLET